MTNILILGGGGMIGQKLAVRLKTDGLDADPSPNITLFDLAFPPHGMPDCTTITGNVADPATAKMLAATKPDVIFLDLDLAGMTGRELLDDLKADEALTGIPVVVLTRSDQDKEAIEAYSFDRSCFFFKKPESCQDWLLILKCIEDVWQTFVEFPSGFSK